ncbi:AraC family transcriptional regulator [Sphingomonas sp. QA11]|uniref:helix-turn-helix domain-containing protein n=1 Tax=Sphingomonas sp. QA11 TaxID=2950605 RepID=UPI00234AC791|nr:AraC family transcriptional regulator [Sphingomonas sp. QA11]WCM27391.1 AraC family transcriptional regulator [Sphingomonas sp. QA11]
MVPKMSGFQKPLPPESLSGTVFAGDWDIEFLPARPYEVRYRAERASIGLAVDPQMGVHAIGTDRRQAFRARVGMVGFIPAGCDVYSASDQGGDYLRLVSSSANSMAITSGESEDRNLLRMILALRAEMLSGMDPLICESLSASIASRLYSLGTAKIGPGKGWITAVRMRRVEEIIAARLGSALLVRDLATELGLSTPFFSRAFGEATGRSPQEHIIQRRLQRARDLVLTSNTSLAMIAAECGFSSQAHMTTLFGRRFGLAPGKLRKNRDFTKETA